MAKMISELNQSLQRLDWNLKEGNVNIINPSLFDGLLVYLDDINDLLEDSINSKVWS